LEEAVRRGNPRLQRFDSSCFTGEYVTGDIDRDYLECLARERSDAAKTNVPTLPRRIVPTPTMPSSICTTTLERKAHFLTGERQASKLPAAPI